MKKGTIMDYKQFEQIINFHKLSTKLKTTLRSGWVTWHLEDERIESVADHIFGTCMLAVAIYGTIKPQNLDINKVITMLMLHETEEIIIGDLTPVDPRLATQKQDGHKAVLEIFKDFEHPEHFLDLIEEFEENSTPEARFARQCDKFEADLQARLYEANFNLNKVSPQVKNFPKIQELNKLGYTDVCELFLQNDKPKFSGEFLEMANFLEKLEKEEKAKRLN